MRREVTLKKLVRGKSYDALERSGFTRFAKEGVDWPINDDFSCWVGLNTSVLPGEVDINPFVGVHVPPLEKLAATLKGKRYDRAIATFSIPMGELQDAEQEQAFVFNLNQSESFIQSEAERLAHIYATVGKSYACSIANYYNLLPMLEGRTSMLGGYPESVVCCLYMMGREDEALDCAKNLLSAEPSYFSPFYDRFVSFIGARQDRYD